MEANIMNIIISIVGILVGGGVAYGFISHFIKLSKEKQIDKIKEWLLYAVIQAEQALGSGTGKVKLRFAYDMFISKFKVTSLLVSFDEFSEMVDEALDIMRNMLESNEKVKQYVENK